jgi:hypothetical protein
MSEQPAANPPVMTHRDGAVFVKVWRNEHEDRAIYNATIGRTYTDKESGEIRESRSLSGDDILKVQPLLGKAYETISQERAMDRSFASSKPEQGLEAQRDAALSQTPKPQETATANPRTRNRQPEQ